MMDQDLQNPWNNDYQDPYQAEQPQAPAAAPAAPAANAGPNPTYGNGTQVGSGTTWAPGSDHPTGAPAGYTWDPNTATFQPTPGTSYTSAQAPVGGNLSDPSYASQLVSWAGNQSGVNPSVKNDPNYWISRFTSGAFGNDQQYAIQRMMQAEGAPEGAGAAAGAAGGTGGTGGAPGATGSTYNFSYNGGSLAPPGVSDQLYKMLLDRAQQSLTVDPNNPIIRQQVDPAAAQIERDRRDYLANVAESRGPLANIKGETRVSEEKGAQMKAQLESGLIGKELQAKRDEITQALNELGSRLTSDQALGLQKELGYLNNALGKYGIDTSAGLQQQQINSGNDQFAQTFGANSTNSANYWDAIRRGLI